MFEMPMMEVPVPKIEEVGLDWIHDLLIERQSLKTLIEDSANKVKEIDEMIGSILDQKELKTVVWNDYLVIRRQGSKPRPILDRVLLLEAGVSPQQLKAGTKLSEPGKPGVTLRSISEAKTKGSEENSI